MLDLESQPAKAAWMAGVDVPTSWTRSKVKHLVRDMRAGSGITFERVEPAGDFPVYGGNGIRGYTDTFTHEGTFILIGRQGALCGNVHLATGAFWASEHAIVCETAEGIDARWSAHLLASMELGQYSATAAQPGISISQVRSLEISIPSTQEQVAIADFLDEQTSRIDKLIAKQKQLVETLRERRISIISKTVSEGLNQEMLRPTGNPFCPLLPASWTLARFGREISINEGLVDPTRAPWSSMNLVAPNHIESLTGRIIRQETSSEQSADSGKYLARRGQVLFSKIRPALNKVTIAPEDCLCSADMYAISSRTGSDHFFLAYWMRSDPFHRFASAISARVKMPKLNREELAAAPWARPPIKEQEQIVSYLDDQTSKVDVLINSVENHIALARERRSALITAAVTGQIDVRTSGNAARMVS